MRLAMFYYTPVAEGKNAWLLMQLACIVVFALGVGVGSLDIWRASRGAMGTVGKLNPILRCAF